MNTKRSAFFVKLVLGLALIAQMIGSVAFPISVLADSTITVTTTDENIASDGQCSLREAITNANNDLATFADCVAGSGADTIELASGAFYTLSAVDNTYGALGANGLPAISSTIMINGKGATIGRDASAGTPNFRLFFIQAFVGDLTLNNLTVKNGHAGSGNGSDSGGGPAPTQGRAGEGEAWRSHR